MLQFCRLLPHRLELNLFTKIQFSKVLRYAIMDQSNLSTESNMKYLSQDEASAFDQELFNEYKYSVDQLMELAGLSCASAIRKTYEPHQFNKVLVVCGPGNNGGDGLVAARHLAMMGYAPHIYYPKRPNNILYQNLTHQCLKHGIPFVEESLTAAQIDSEFNIVLDGLFGFSFKPPVRESFLPIMTAMAEMKTICCSIDIPSGWDVNSGPPSSGPLINPQMLISLSAPKNCAKFYKNGIHFLGGRFVPPDLLKKYNLTLPPYEIADQVVLLENK